MKVPAQVLTKIKEILADIQANDYSSDEMEIRINNLIRSGTWSDVRDSLLLLLYNQDQTLWQSTIEMIYFLQNRGLEFEGVKTIPILYSCLEQSENLDSNLVWTIVRNIKGLTYLDNYDPYNDAEIFQAMQNISKLRLKDGETY